MNKQGFNLHAAIVAAWDFCWQDNLKRRANNGDFRGNTYYLTASDIEDQVRQFAWESSQGKEWGSTGRAWGGARGEIRISVPGSTLQHEVRDYLLHNRGITGHNFSRGHISGMRFRPRGEPLSPAEQKTFKAQQEKEEKRARGEPTYTRHASSGQYGLALCVKAQRDKKIAAAKAAGRSAPWFGSNHRSRVWTTDKLEEVTCPRCRNLKESKQ